MPIYYHLKPIECIIFYYIPDSWKCLGIEVSSILWTNWQTSWSGCLLSTYLFISLYCWSVCYRLLSYSLLKTRNKAPSSSWTITTKAACIILYMIFTKTTQTCLKMSNYAFKLIFCRTAVTDTNICIPSLHHIPNSDPHFGVYWRLNGNLFCYCLTFSCRIECIFCMYREKKIKIKLA